MDPTETLLGAYVDDLEGLHVYQEAGAVKPVVGPEAREVVAPGVGGVLAEEVHGVGVLAQDVGLRPGPVVWGQRGEAHLKVKVGEEWPRRVAFAYGAHGLAWVDDLALFDEDVVQVGVLGSQVGEAQEARQRGVLHQDDVPPDPVATGVDDLTWGHGQDGVAEVSVPRSAGEVDVHSGVFIGGQAHLGPGSRVLGV